MKTLLVIAVLGLSAPAIAGNTTDCNENNSTGKNEKREYYANYAGDLADKRYKAKVKATKNKEVK